MDVDAFHQLLEELAADIPPEFFRKLNGGIITLPETKFHPKAQDTYVLGEYRVERPGMGRYIVIYYGSFRKVLGPDPPASLLRRRLWETLLHEIRHHLEALAGVRDLEREDERRLQKLLTRQK